jgi:hypothetical protein
MLSDAGSGDPLLRVTPPVRTGVRRKLSAGQFGEVDVALAQLYYWHRGRSHPRVLPDHRPMSRRDLRDEFNEHPYSAELWRREGWQLVLGGERDFASEMRRHVLREVGC